MAAADYVSGYQYIGIPTQDMEATIAFYTALGFRKSYETGDNGRVIFFECGPVLVKVYEDGAREKNGPIDHLALAVRDLDRTLSEIRKAGISVIEGPRFLPFWENGMSYFKVRGPNQEILSFVQRF